MAYMLFPDVGMTPVFPLLRGHALLSGCREGLQPLTLKVEKPKMVGMSGETVNKNTGSATANKKQMMC